MESFDPGIEAQRGDDVFERLLERPRVEVAGAFVEQGGGHVGETLLALGVERPAAALKAKRTLITGIDRSSTSQASIPPGERTRWISVAAAGKASASASTAAPMQDRA